MFLIKSLFLFSFSIIADNITVAWLALKLNLINSKKKKKKKKKEKQNSTNEKKAFEKHYVKIILKVITFV